MTTSSQEGNGPRPLTDEKMEQVRELLFGDFEKQTEMRVQVLEGRVRELEVMLQRRFDALEARMEALAGELDVSQRASHQEIAVGLEDLAERLRRISGGQG